MDDQTLNINLGKRSYPIYIGIGNLETIGQKLKDSGLPNRATIISNPEIIELYGKQVSQSLKKNGIDSIIITVQSGEESKSLETAAKIYDKLIANRNDRYTPIIALGGGVIGDLGGFVASTYMRGVPYIQVPTTLLAQVDSSIGGKVAVNHPQAKNIIGSFYQPKFVLADMATLRSLPEREYLSGVAEVAKYAFISANNFLKYLENNLDRVLARDAEVLSEIVLKCCNIKGKIVEEDERDYSLRAVLNFGHTIGHSIEAISHYENYRHGEAVAIGILGAAIVSNIRGYAQDSLIDETRTLLRNLKLPTSVNGLPLDDIIEHIKLDKKVVEGKVRFVMLKEPGEMVIENVDSKTIMQALKRLAEEKSNA